MSNNGMTVLVTGAGSLIGRRLAEYLVGQGYGARGFDINPLEFRQTATHELVHEFVVADLRDYDNCVASVVEAERVVPWGRRRCSHILAAYKTQH